MKASNNRELSLKLYVVLHHAFNAFQTEAFKDMRTHGLNPTAFAVLELLYSKGPQQVQHIGEKVLISSSSITYVVNNLEKEDYVKKEQYEADRRVSYVSLTGRGQALMDKIFPEHGRAPGTGGGWPRSEREGTIDRTAQEAGEECFDIAYLICDTILTKERYHGRTESGNSLL